MAILVVGGPRAPAWPRREPAPPRVQFGGSLVPSDARGAASIRSLQRTSTTRCRAGCVAGGWPAPVAAGPAAQAAGEQGALDAGDPRQRVPIVARRGPGYERPQARVVVPVGVRQCLLDRPSEGRVRGPG